MLGGWAEVAVAPDFLTFALPDELDFGQGANWATIVDIGGGYAGVATGFINMVGNMGNPFQPVIGQWVFHSYGWSVLFVVYAAAFLVAASMWLFIDPTRPFYERSGTKPAEPAEVEAVPVAEPG